MREEVERKERGVKKEMEQCDAALRQFRLRGKDRNIKNYRSNGQTQILLLL